MTDRLDLCPLIDTEIAAVLDALPIDLGARFDGLTVESLSEVRAMMADGPIPELSDRVERTDHAVSAHVSVRVHRPVGVDGDLPCLYWMHGGGLVFGTNQRDDLRFDRWCQAHEMVGVSVEYRLAPEAPYPGPLDDCLAGLAWVVDNAAELGVDPACIGIGGVSAGGGLATATALRLRDEGGPPVRFQLLVYPMLDDRQITTSSGWNDPVWPPVANAFGWSSYLGDAKGGPDVSGYAAAARASDLAGLPPTLIVVGALDGFSDEDIDYAVRLRHAGVPVDLYVYSGAPHGFESFFPGTTIARQATSDMSAWLGRQLAAIA